MVLSVPGDSQGAWRLRRQGLTRGEVRHRRKAHGPNRLRETKAKNEWQILGEQFNSLITVLLAAASVVSFLFGDWVEGLTIVAVILINAAIRFFAELRAIRSMEALYRLGRVTTRVGREGRIVDIPLEEIVPGDIVILEGGDVVTADLRLVRASKLQADESALTGESMPVKKVWPTSGKRLLWLNGRTCCSREPP